MNATVTKLPRVRVGAPGRTKKSAETGRSNVQPEGEDTASKQFWSKHHALEPPVPPERWYNAYAGSYALRPLIDVYAVNIDGSPHTLELRLDPDDPSEKTTQAIRDVILVERMWDWNAAGAKEGELNLEISDAQVEARREEIRVASRIEKLRLDMFFAQPCPGYGLIQLRKRLRLDLETQGNAFMEVLRNPQGQITQLVYASAINIRLVKVKEQAKAKWRRRITPVSYRDHETWIRHRHYVQEQENGTPTYFKSLGEPGLFSADTNKRFKSEAEMREAEPKGRIATELIHLRVFDSSSAYGQPRWQGAARAVAGSTMSEDYNRAYFSRNTMPPGLLLVSGGRGLAKRTEEKLKTLLAEQAKGVMDKWSLITIEALGPKGGATAPQMKPPAVTLEWVPLEPRQEDALFQRYDERNEKKVRNSYRLPKLLIGDSEDANRSTQEAALRYSNEQVFQPERDDEDAVYNDQLFPAMDVRYWLFVSHGPKQRDAGTISEVLARLRYAMTPNEQREIINELLHRELPRIEAAWGDRPERIYLGELQAGIQQLQAMAHGRPGAFDESGATGVAADSELGRLLENMSTLHDRLSTEAAERQQAELQAAREATAQAEPERVTLSAPAELVEEIKEADDACGSDPNPD
jgi:capsid portal protein